MNDWMSATFGGFLIGISVSVMLLSTGRPAGISGIIYGLIKPVTQDMAWRIYFISGMFFGGIAFKIFYPTAIEQTLQVSTLTVLIAGLMVGFGTVLSSGCTSGHGVCGVSRLSIRSMTATSVFIASGVLAVTFFRFIGVLP